MQETNRARVEISAESTEVITAETVLVPPVIDGSYVASKDKKERRERTQVVDSHPLLQLHPFFDFGGVIPLSPSLQIDDHHPRVEVAGLPIGEGERERGVGPERRGEIRGEVGVAVFGGSEDRLVPQRGICQLGNVVDEDKVGVQVHHAPHAEWKEVGQVGACVIQGAIES
ncbi:hypothetical protein V8G54_006830 [Vigna mungo]|uniref:Uncharacterized protein n=1 Tax=Vigna mungo TaxID=3915 RepID=A0AAQ3P454_VIGMU